jgi:hypothetical protein
MKRVSGFVLSLAFVVVLIPTSTYAQVTTQQSVTDVQCVKAKEKIASHKASIASLQTERTAVHTRITNTINTYLSTASDAEYTGIAALTSARDGVTKAISTYTAQVSVYTVALEKAQAAGCSDGASEFTTALNTARTELVTLRSNSIAVKIAVKEGAVPALQNYAAWLKTN